ncbi:MAG TPA: protein usg [Beijerinckiaceae bacterium]|nr:protein usg [Beijerinckiaceae bacterium]
MTAASKSRPAKDGYGMTTAQILYRAPDFHHLVREHIWTGYDQAPDYPALRRFLESWSRSLETSLLSVTITQAEEKPSAGTPGGSHFYLLN